MAEEFSTKSASRETEAEFIEIRIQIFGRQSVKGAQDKGFRIAYHNMEPAQSATVWVVQTGSVIKIRQCRDKTLEAIGMNDSIFGEKSFRKCLNGLFADIFSLFHFEKLWIFLFIQRQSNEYLGFLCTTSALLTYRWTAEKSIVKFDFVFQPICIISYRLVLQMSDRIYRLVCDTKAGLQSYHRNSPVILRHKIIVRKLYCNRQIAAV